MSEVLAEGSTLLLHTHTQPTPHPHLNSMLPGTARKENTTPHITSIVALCRVRPELQSSTTPSEVLQNMVIGPAKSAPDRVAL